MLFSKRDGRITWANDKAIAQKRESKNTSLPSVRAIGPAGQVVDLPVATGRGIPTNRNMYKPQILAEKQRKGWVLYDSLGEKERESLIAERKAAQAERSRVYAESMETDSTQLASVLRELTGSNKSAPAAPKGKGRG